MFSSETWKMHPCKSAFGAWKEVKIDFGECHWIFMSVCTNSRSFSCYWRGVLSPGTSLHSVWQLVFNNWLSDSLILLMWSWAPPDGGTPDRLVCLGCSNWEATRWQKFICRNSSSWEVPVQVNVGFGVWPISNTSYWQLDTNVLRGKGTQPPGSCWENGGLPPHQGHASVGHSGSTLQPGRPLTPCGAHLLSCK